MFSLRIVNVDHYMSPPKPGIDLTYSQFRGNQIKTVPIIRVFGSTPSGVKACLHVHGVFPYLLIPYSGQEDAGRFLYQLASSLDKAINVSLGTSYSQKQHVFKITQVSGRPFYGYHGQDYQFLKIFFYSPLIIKRASDLLQKGAVCGTQFQIHESHVPFILQFFIDYNLYGMSFINLKSVVFRKDGNPVGVAPGTLVKDSFCELEADAVAVDILNRLTVEGELAVNPGLAAIWKEEKERLQKDALDSSQRATPQRTMSEVLLMDKLKENLRFQGKCKPSLKERIPYPVESQRSDSNEMLDASVLDTHSVTSLLPSDRTVDAPAVVDEELALSFSQNATISGSLDQSLLLALDVLAAPHEDWGATIAQNVEDDSILGSQMLPEGGGWSENGPEDDQAAVDFSLPQDCGVPDEGEESDENFDAKIPQVDGVGDIVTKKNKTSTKRKRTSLVKNPSCEENVVFNVEDSLVNDVKDSGCWPDSGKQEGLEEIFSDEEPFNSPIHNFEDNASTEEEPLNIDFVTSFDTVLRGDPALPCDDVPSSEELLHILQKNDESGWNILNITNSDETCNKSYLCTDFDNCKLADTIFDIESVDDGLLSDGSKDNSNSISDVPLPSNPSVAAEKQMAFPFLSEDFLNTCQLDDILNEDLNKGLDDICENDAEFNAPESPFLQPISAESKNCEMPTIDNESYGQNTNTDEQVPASMAFLEPDIGDETVPDNSTTSSSCIHLVNQSPVIVTSSSSMESQTETTTSNNPKNKQVQKKKETTKMDKTKTCGKPDSEPETPTKGKIVDDNGVKLNSPVKSINNSSSTKNSSKKHKFVIKMFEEKKSASHCGLSDMTDAEIKQYFSQLEYIASYFAGTTDKGCDEQKLKSTLWNPIRDFTKIKKAKARKEKTNKLLPIMKIINFSRGEITKFNNCSVRLQRLTLKAVKMLCHRHNFKTDLSVFRKRSTGSSKLKKLTDKGKKKNSYKRGDKPFKSIENVKLKEKLEFSMNTATPSSNCERNEEAKFERTNDCISSDLSVTRSTATIENQITAQATNCDHITHLVQDIRGTTENTHRSSKCVGPVLKTNTTNKQLPRDKKNPMKKQKISHKHKPKDKRSSRTSNKNKIQKKRILNPSSDVKIVNSSKNRKVRSTSTSGSLSHVANDSVVTSDILKSDNTMTAEKIKRRIKSKIESRMKVKDMSHTSISDNIKVKELSGVNKKKPTLKRSCKDVNSISSENSVPNLKLGLMGSKDIKHKEMERTGHKENSNVNFTVIDEKEISKKSENLMCKNSNLNNNNVDNNTTQLNKSSLSEKISDYQSQVVDNTVHKEKPTLKRSIIDISSKASSENSNPNLKLESRGTKYIKPKKMERTSQKENSIVMRTLTNEKNDNLMGNKTNLNNTNVDDNNKSKLNTSSLSGKIPSQNQSHVENHSVATISILKSVNQKKIKSKEITKRRIKNKKANHGKVNKMSLGNTSDKNKFKNPSDAHKKRPTLKRSCKNVSLNISSEKGIHNLKIGLTGSKEIVHKEMEGTSQKENSNVICTLIDKKEVSSKKEYMMGKHTNLNNNVDNNSSKFIISSSSEQIQMTTGNNNYASVANIEVESKLSGLTETKSVKIKEIEDVNGKENISIICKLNNNNVMEEKKGNNSNIHINLNNNNSENVESKLNIVSKSKGINDTFLNNQSESRNVRLSSQNVKADLKHNGLPRKKEIRKEKFEQKYQKQSDISTICTPSKNDREESKESTINGNTISKSRLNKTSSQPSQISTQKSNCSDITTDLESKCIETAALDLNSKSLHGALKKTKNKSSKRSKNNDKISVLDTERLEQTNKTLISEDSNLNNDNCVYSLDGRINQIKSQLPVVELHDDIPLIEFTNSKLKTIPNKDVTDNINTERRHTFASQTKKDDNSKSNPKLKSNTSDFSMSKTSTRTPIVCLDVHNISVELDSNKSELPVTKNIVDDSKSANIMCSSNEMKDSDLNCLKSHQAKYSNATVMDIQKPVMGKLQTSKSFLRKRSFSFDSNDTSQSGFKERKRKSFRIVSLDGTYDNSSSDENVEEIVDDIDAGAASNSCSTPRKTRSLSSRTSRSPKTKYVPLNIEIKKSPKAKLAPLAETQSTSVQSVNIQQSTKLAVEATQENNYCDDKSRDIEVSEVVETKCEFDRKRRRLEPSVMVMVERLMLPPIQETSRPAVVGMNSEVPSHSCAKDPETRLIHPSVKRLKVSVRRLSLNAQGCTDDDQSGAPTVSTRKSHRSASLPVTTK